MVPSVQASFPFSVPLPGPAVLSPGVVSYPLGLAPRPGDASEAACAPVPGFPSSAPPNVGGCIPGGPHPSRHLPSPGRRGSPLWVGLSLPYAQICRAVDLPKDISVIVLSRASFWQDWLP